MCFACWPLTDLVGDGWWLERWLGLAWHLSSAALCRQVRIWRKTYMSPCRCIFNSAFVELKYHSDSGPKRHVLNITLGEAVVSKKALYIKYLLSLENALLSGIYIYTAIQCGHLSWLYHFDFVQGCIHWTTFTRSSKWIGNHNTHLCLLRGERYMMHCPGEALVNRIWHARWTHAGGHQV